MTLSDQGPGVDTPKLTCHGYKCSTLRTVQPTSITDSDERHLMALKARTINVYPNNDPTGHTPGMTCVCTPTSDTQENGWVIITHQEIPE